MGHIFLDEKANMLNSDCTEKGGSPGPRAEGGGGAAAAGGARERGTRQDGRGEKGEGASRLRSVAGGKEKGS